MDLQVGGAVSAEQQVTRSVEVSAEPARVWESLTDPSRLGRWLDAEVELDVRPGGEGVVREAGGPVRRVAVEQVDPPGRLVFHWWPADRHGRTPAESGATTVEIAVTPSAAGARVTVTETAPRGPVALVGQGAARDLASRRGVLAAAVAGPGGRHLAGVGRAGRGRA